jgi:hypothetical protein
VCQRTTLVLYGVQYIFIYFLFVMSFKAWSFFPSDGRSGLALQMLAAQPLASHVPLTTEPLSWLEIRSGKGFGTLHYLHDVPGHIHTAVPWRGREGVEKGMKKEMRIGIEGKYLTNSSERLLGSRDVGYCFLRAQSWGVEERSLVVVGGFCSTFPRTS